MDVWRRKKKNYLSDISVKAHSDGKRWSKGVAVKRHPKRCVKKNTQWVHGFKRCMIITMQISVKTWVVGNLWIIEAYCRQEINMDTLNGPMSTTFLVYVFWQQLRPSCCPCKKPHISNMLNYFWLLHLWCFPASSVSDGCRSSERMVQNASLLAAAELRTARCSRSGHKAKQLLVFLLCTFSYLPFCYVRSPRLREAVPKIPRDTP